MNAHNKNTKFLRLDMYYYHYHNIESCQITTNDYNNHTSLNGNLKV